MFYTILLNVGVMNVLYNFIKCGVYECSMQFLLNVGVMNVRFNSIFQFYCE
jgi:hypothetical protein